MAGVWNEISIAEELVALFAGSALTRRDAADPWQERRAGGGVAAAAAAREPGHLLADPGRRRAVTPLSAAIEREQYKLSSLRLLLGALTAIQQQAAAPRARSKLLTLPTLPTPDEA